MNTHRKILIFEDNPDICIALSEVLADCGHDIETAKNGKDGLDHLINHLLPDLIILDMFLPVINGLEFKRRLEMMPDLAFIPVIAMSADVFMKRRCLASGLTHFLKKPFELQELLDLMDELMLRKDKHS